MSRIFITLADIPREDRYIALSDGVKSSLYRRYLYIIYIRVSKVYTGHHIWTTLIILAIVKNLKFKRK